MPKSPAFRVGFFQSALKDSASKSSRTSPGKRNKYVTIRYLSLTNLQNDSEKLLTTETAEGDWFLVFATYLEAWSEPSEQACSTPVSFYRPIFSEGSIIYAFSPLFMPLFNYLWELRGQSMSEIYADTVAILEHLKLGHRFFMYCNISCHEENNQY